MPVNRVAAPPSDPSQLANTRWSTMVRASQLPPAVAGAHPKGAVRQLPWKECGEDLGGDRLARSAEIIVRPLADARPVVIR